MSRFDTPLYAWTDAELDAGIRVLFERSSEHAAAGRPREADWAAGMAEILIREQESRAALAREVNSVFVRSWVETRPGEEPDTVTG